MMRTLFDSFKYSIVLFISIVLSVIVYYNTSLPIEVSRLINNFDLFYFVIAGLSCYIAALSFAIPYLKFKNKNLKDHLKGIIKYVYIDSSGGEGDAFISKFADISKEKVIGIKTADLLATIMMSFFLCLFLEINLIYFFLVVVGLEILLFLFLIKGLKMPFESKSLFYNIIRYLFEFPRTLFTFYAAGLFLNPVIIFCLLTTSSALYFLPRFRGAGGLLSLYLMIFTSFIGLGILYGLFVAILFRINAIIFFSFPLYLMKRWKS